MNKNKGFIGVGLIIAIIIVVSVIGGGAYYLGQKNAEKNQLIQNSGTLQPSAPLKDFSNTPSNNIPAKQNIIPIMKLYKNDKFSFLYNSNATAIEAKTKSGDIFNVYVSSIGETNKEKGIYVYFYTKGETNFRSCENLTNIKGKMFCISSAGGTDGSYIYSEGNKELMIWFTTEDTNALSDNRYIDLGSLQIY